MHNAEYAVEQKKPVFCPALGEEILEIQTGTKQLIDQKNATVIKQLVDNQADQYLVNLGDHKQFLYNIKI